MNKRLFILIIILLDCVISFSQTFFPTDIPELIIWYSADSVNLNGQNVDILYDKSGNDFHATQATSASQPLQVTDQLNGYPVIRFSNDYIDVILGETFAQPNTIFIVWNINSLSGTDHQYVFDNYSTSNRAILMFWENIGISMINSSNKWYSKTAPFDYILSTVVYNGANDNIFENGELKLQGSYNSATIQGLRLGSNAYLSRPLYGDIAELIVYNNLLDNEEREQVEDFIMNKYSPELDLGEDIVIDYGFCDTTLIVDSSFDNINWSTGETNDTIVINKSGTYWVQVQDNFGRQRLDTIYVSFPETSPLSNSNFLCQYSDISISSSLPIEEDYTYGWNTGDNTHTILIDQPGDYWFTVTDNLGCSKVSDTINIYLDDFPLSFSLGNDTSLCMGNSFSAPYNPNWEYLWSNSDTSHTIQILAEGIYSISVTNQNGCVAEDDIFISIEGIAPIVNFSLPENVCVDATFEIENFSSGTDIIGYLWDFGDGTTTSTEINPVHTYTMSGDFQLRLDVFSESGCDNFIEQTVHVYENPQADFIFSPVCVGNDVFFFDNSQDFGNEISEYSWDFDNGDTSTEQNPVSLFDIESEHFVSLEITSDKGCKDSVVKTIIPEAELPNPLPAYVISPPSEYYTSDNTITFIWQPQTSNNIQYIWQCSESPDFLSVLYEEVFLLPENNINWNNNPDEIEIIKNLQQGNYYWRILSYNPCQEVISTPVYDLTVLNSEGLVVHYTAEPDNINKSAADSVMAILDISGHNNHSEQTDQDYQALWIPDALNNSPAIAFGENSPSYYLFDELILNDFTIIAVTNPDIPDLPVHYLLSGENSQGVFTNGEMITGPGVFDSENILNAADNYNEWQLASITNEQIFINSQEVLYASSSPVESLSLNILGSRNQAIENQYFKGKIAELMIFNYKLSAQDINDYEEYLRQKYFPPVNLGNDISLNCGECIYSIDAPVGFSSYYWSTGETGSSITVNQSGTYTLTVTDIFGYTSSDEINFECPQQSCDPAPNIGQDIYVEYGFCPVEISVNDIYSNYIWSNGGNQASTIVNQQGTYYLTATSIDGYVFTDSISVYYPEINLTDTIICLSQNMMLDPNLDGEYSYFWSNSSLNPYIQIYNPGEYWVQITDTSNCSIIKTANVAIDNFPLNISLGNDTLLCSGNNIKLTEGAGETVNYIWLPGGETDSILYVFESGEYQVIAENINSCVARDTILIDIQGNAPVPDFVAEYLCFGDTTQFTDLSFNQDSIANRTWIINSTDTLNLDSPEYVFSFAGTNNVQLIVESNSGCISDTLIYINILESPEVNFLYLPICTDNPVEFVSNVTIPEPETITNLSWEIDGTFVDNSDNLIYNFSEDDNYLVSLTAVASNSCAAKYEEMVTAQSSYPLPESFDIISPQGSVYNNYIDFSWESSQNAVYYRLILAHDYNFNDVIIDLDSIFTNNTILELEELEDTIYWKVEAFNPCLNVVTSNIAFIKFFSPYNINELKLWLSADSVRLNEGKVDIWYDKSGNNFNAIQNEQSRQPSLVNNKLNNHPVLSFNDDYLDIDFESSFTQPNTIFIVWSIESLSGNDNQFIYDNTVPNNRTVLVFWENQGISINNSVDNIYEKSAPFNHILSTAIYNNSYDQLFENGVLKIQGSLNNAMIDGLRIGSNSYLTRPMHGDIAEIIFYNSLLNTNEREQVENYLAYKYSPKLNLGPDIIVDYGVCGVEIGIDSNFDNILWSTGDTVDNIIVTQAGQYTVQASVFGKMQYDTININIPSPGYPEQTSFCSGNNIVWDTQMGNDYSFEWSVEGETDSQITINEEGFYSVLITDTIGCQLQSDTLYFEENMYEFTTSIGPSDTTMCSGNPLALISNIEETESYLWSTGSTEEQIIVTESGTYSVTTTNIVGCIAISQTNVTISGTAPQADFEFTGQCEQNTISFTDLSVPTGEEIISWEWKINGDEFSQQQNPEYIFAEPGTYNISLTVTSEGGCSNTTTQSINIYPKPEVSFTPQNLCQNSVNSIYSTSYVENGTIQENYWYINGNLYTSDQIDITVENEDSFEIKLISVSEHGCSDSIVSSIETRNNPIPQFTFSPICESTPAYFINNTQTEIYNPPLAYQWDFGDGGSSTISDPEYIYSASGEYDVSLEMSYNNGCSSTSTQTINVFANPSAEISNLNSCFGELYMPIDASVSEDGDIVSWKWVIERPELPSGYTTYYSQSPSFIPSDTGAYNIALTVNSEYGCTNTKNTSYNVWNSSMASFTASQTWGGVPFYVSFNNTSENAVEYFWDFGDDNTSIEIEPDHVFQDTGSFVVKLISFSENDCSDTASLQLNAVIPVLDILLLDFQVENVNNYLTCDVIVVNNGTLPVSNIEMIITIPSKGTFREILDYIEPGKTINYTFDTEIYYQGNGLPEIICVEAKPDIISNYYQDENLEDNVICLSSLNQLRAYPPYPNPADELLYFEFFSNQNYDINIKLINSTGKLISSYSLTSFYGYKRLELELNSLTQGLYFLNITNGEEQFSYKFIKN